MGHPKRPRFGRVRSSKPHASRAQFIRWDDRRYTHGVDDRFDGVCVGVPAGTVTTAVCVKTWPSDVWRTKEKLEVKDGFEAGVEEALSGVEDEDVGAVELDAAALEDRLEEDELAAGVEELDGVVVVCGVVVGVACEEGGGGELEVALGSAVVAGVVATGGCLWRNVSTLKSHYAQHDLR